MPKVTLVLASGPGFPNGDPECRYEIDVTLDGTGRLDPEAWYADPSPWPARRHWRDEWPRDGDVQLDEETGAWSLRFFPKPGEAGEAARVLDPHTRDLVVGRDEAVGTDGGGAGGHRCSAPTAPRLRRAPSISSTVCPLLGSPPAMSRSISSVVGMAVEHSRRLVTMAPAALQRVSVSSRDWPVSRPWQSEPPKLSPAPDRPA